MLARTSTFAAHLPCTATMAGSRRRTRPRTPTLAALGLLVCLVSVSTAGALEPRGALGDEASPSAAPSPILAQVGEYQDVDPDSYAAQPIASLAADGVFEGTECDEGFCPDDPIDRATMAVWTVRVLDGADPQPVASTRFTDVHASHPHAPFIERFAERGVTRGCRDGTVFCPDDSVIRAQMAAFLSRAYSLSEGPDPGFSDVAPNAWYASDVARLAASGITKGCGDGTRFCPDQPTSRAQMAAFLHRAVSLDAGPLSVAVESTAPLLVLGDFDVTITFSKQVDGLSRSALQVVNGEVSSLTGTGARYQATIKPRALGSVFVRIRPGAATAGTGNSNPASNPLTRTRVTDTARSRPGTDTWNRAAVLDAYAAEFDRVEPDPGYTGDSDNCVAGMTSQSFRDGVVQRVNWYRQMSGLGTVTENPEYSAAAQQAALTMAAQGQLSHYPPSDWACHSATGAAAAAKSNLHVFWSSYPAGIAGIDAVSGYMQDSGANNANVGHRRWILYPQLLEIGTGDALHAGDSYVYANALYVLDDNVWADRPEVREQRDFVAWPPSGYVPAQTVWGRWSFALQHADFSSATVAIADDSGPVQVDVITRDSGGGAPENAIVWAVGGDTSSALLPRPDDGDHCYTVTISGVRVSGAIQAPYEYAVCVLGPDR